ncbi:Crp/Fnr family transcriptional regulator [Plantactinospora endophytica]|uniref:Crp/Fnr family transcriptional regulator n=1 Tax=Plantactinospora endophytica TaxID=673535 RepID=A0ABQ4ECE2_9ACTN|nr:Crp/Fnr family transcriptional regulator [Plantactinospora endophytica]GIG92403.1 Crp/Fnr family transcriptional regulator [Plantactinospora endophytica]
MPPRPDLPPTADWPHGTLLSRLDPDARAELLGLGVRRRVAAGQILLHEGAEGSHLVLLRQGLTKVTASHPDGRSTLLAIRFRGDLVGEMSALNGRPRSATVTTCGPAVVNIIQLHQFKPFLRNHPEAAFEMTAMVADRLRWSNQRRIEFTSYPARVRVARIIAELARSHGRRTPDGIVIDIHLTQPELATACGAADTTIEKTLRQLRADGVVDTDYRRITIRDLGQLWEICRFDPIDGR